MHRAIPARPKPFLKALVAPSATRHAVDCNIWPAILPLWVFYDILYVSTFFICAFLFTTHIQNLSRTFTTVQLCLEMKDVGEWKRSWKWSVRDLSTKSRKKKRKKHFVLLWQTWKELTHTGILSASHLCANTLMLLNISTPKWSKISPN